MPSSDLREISERVIDEFGFASPDRPTALNLVAKIACAWAVEGAMTAEEALSIVAHTFLEFGELRPEPALDNVFGFWFEDPPSRPTATTRWRQSPGWKPVDLDDRTGWRQQWGADAISAMRELVAATNIAADLSAATDPTS
ncbi:MAG: hypothetical protein ABI632_09475 [Pseudolysinimonas sp.]